MELAGVVPALEHADIGPFTAAGEQVGAHDGVVVQTLVAHVAVVLHDVLGRYVQRHLVTEELGGVAELDVVAVVCATRDDGLVVDGRCGKVCLVLVVTRREREGLGPGEAILEVVAAGIVAVVVALLERKAPAADDGTLAGVEVTGSVTVLELGKTGYAGELRVGREGDGGLLGRSFLGGYHNGAVGSAGAVEGGSGCTRQDGDGLDVLGVEVGDGVGLAGGAELGTCILHGGGHGNTVNHVDGVVALRDGLGTAHDSLGCTTDTGGRTVEDQAGHLTVEGIDEVGILGGEQVLGLHFLHVVGKGFLRTADTQGGDNRTFQHLGLFLEDDAIAGAGVDGKGDRGVAQARKLKGCVGILHRDGKLKAAVDVGAGTDGGAFDDDGAADDGLTGCVHDETLYDLGTILLLFGLGLRSNHDGRALDLIRNMDGRKHGVQRLIYAFTFHLGGYSLPGVYVHVDKQVVGLLLDALDSRFHRSLLEVQGNQLSLRAERSGAESQQQRQENLADDCFLHDFLVKV